ncbi:isopentenyl-diphosphate Delta-isomerase [Clostridium cibarium]|uniref:Isopentenyl-diphosphate delta-isomerase n=1 Tax=Clostridium cibarium TaxID=2762247 RepID=A0ABR8PT94_9CLOT|nr:isopentenyl-diphosphate Delta-isomerase [Clostridium cibarium]MBD7911396.1 isopentenyl-diphosphate Delta-isomerase [Clostridium cibarium]
MEEVILVDKKDNIVGKCEKIEAHHKGLRHRAFSVFIFNSKGEMLIQKRALHKYHSPGLWSNSCCSHPRINETTEYAAHRRLKEELGFDCEIIEKTTFCYETSLNNNLYENEYDHIFVGIYDGIVIVNDDEIEEFAWINMKELLKEVEKKPDDFTFWFKKILNYNIKEIC